MTDPHKPYLSQEFAYATHHALQTLHLTLPTNPTPPTKDRLFLIYIHGGAWRDPAQFSADFAATTARLLSCARARSRIAGIAAVNYGLSAYPSQPSTDPSRTYTHPQHVEDVRLALHWLWHRYGVGAEDGWAYVLVGHSCGAMMALQVAMAGEEDKLFQCMARPRGIVGVEGIYDLELLVRNHAQVPVYEEFVRGAFGDDRQAWRAASPVHFGDRIAQYLAGGVVLIAHSSEDELVEQEQADAMVAALKAASTSPSSSNVVSIGLRGTHDEVWQKGIELERAVLAAIEQTPSSP